MASAARTLSGKAWPDFDGERFRSPFPEFEDRGAWDVFRMLTSGDTPKSSYEALPTREPDAALLAEPRAEIQATWIGHATCFVQMSGINILTDPVWSERASPVSFAGPKRYTPVPCRIADLPPVNLVVISHNHYDHFDIPTIQQLGPAARWIVPTGLKALLVESGIPGELVHEMMWWDEVDVAPGLLGDGPAQLAPRRLHALPRDNAAVASEHAGLDGTAHITVTAVPAQHWSNRSLLMDRNRSLWCGYHMRAAGSGRSFLFAGDTGYTAYFKEMGRELGPIDLAAIPIGAYVPRWFMRPQHVDPAEAVMMHRDLRVRKSFAIHWGTFPMTKESTYEPEELLAEARRDQGLEDEEFVTLRPGDTLCVE